MRVKFIAAYLYPLEDFPKSPSTKFIFGSELEDNEERSAVYVDLLPEFLTKGKYVAAPGRHVIEEVSKMLRLLFT